MFRHQTDDRLIGIKTQFLESHVHQRAKNNYGATEDKERGPR
jgi:hypothetical protein